MSNITQWGDFPRIGLIIAGKKKFYTQSEAVRIWDQGFVHVDDSGERLPALLFLY